MLYYKLGQKELKPVIAEAGRRWAEFGANRPVTRKLLVIVVSIVTFFVVLSGLAPTYAPDYDPKSYLAAAKNSLGNV